MVEGLNNIVRDIVREVLVLMMGDRRIKGSKRLIIVVPMLGNDAQRTVVSQTFGSM